MTAGNLDPWAGPTPPRREPPGYRPPGAPPLAPPPAIPPAPGPGQTFDDVLNPQEA